MSLPDIVPPEPPVQFVTPQIAPLDAEVDSLIRVVEARNAFRVSGKGLTVAVLDTGLRATHVDFAGSVVAQRNFTTDNGGDPTNAADGNGHGTNVGGIIVAHEIHRGIAPRAGIAPLKVLTNSGGGNFEAVRQALTWVLETHKTHRITVVSMSLGANTNDTNDAAFSSDPVRELIAQLRTRRIPVVIAAGNGYFQWKKEGMAYPAILRDGVSVGAVYDSNVGGFSYGGGATAHTTGADRITPFSQRLALSTNAATRTDVFGPGAPVTSSGNLNDHGESVQHGTSQATPVVSGVILLMQEYYFRATGRLPTVDLLVSCLRAGAKTITDGDDEDDNVPHTQKKYLRVDAVGALRCLRSVLLKHLLQTKTLLRVEGAAFEESPHAPSLDVPASLLARVE